MMSAAIPVHLIEQEEAALKAASEELAVAKEEVERAKARYQEAIQRLDTARARAILQWEKDDPEGFRTVLQPEDPDPRHSTELEQLSLAIKFVAEPYRWTRSGRWLRVQLGLPDILVR